MSHRAIRSLESPVVLMTFNRPEKAIEALLRIRVARPKRLVLVSDGARNSVAGEAIVVENLRNALEDLIDWPTDLTRHYAQENMGCGRRLSSAIEAVLRRFGRGIFVEDDCWPADGFLAYCEAMLDRFEGEERVGSITGSNLRPHRGKDVKLRTVHFPCIWGWATWQRGWTGYDRLLQGWNSDFIDEIAEEGHIPSFLPDTWKEVMAWVKRNPESTWDVQFWLLCLRKRALTIVPPTNLIENVGSVGDGTHFSSRRFRIATGELARIPTGDGIPPIDKRYERWLQREFYGNVTTLENFPWKVVHKAGAYWRALRRLGPRC